MKRFITMTIALVVSMVMLADGDYSLYIAAETTSHYKISTVQKLTFENGNMVVNFKDGTTKSTAISAVSRLYFGIASAISQDVNNDGTVDDKDVQAVYGGMESGETDGLDVNGDEAVDTQDVLDVYEYIKEN